MPYYAVAKGRSKGVYTDWNACKDNVTGYSGAVYKKFLTMLEAQAFLAGGSYTSGSLGHTPSQSSSLTSYSRPPSGGKGTSLRTKASAGVIANKLNATLLSSPGSAAKYPTQPVYVDGASRANGKAAIPISGYGVYYGPQSSKNAAVPLSSVDDVTKVKPTNQRAELHAIKHVLDDIADEIRTKPISRKYSIHSDSIYAQNCVGVWADNWKSNSWKSTTGKPVANRDIIENAVKTLDYINQTYQKEGLGKLEFYHVKGHSGDPGNEAADRLANQGADEMQRWSAKG